MRVIIAGGGTGGLATAIALRKVGIEPLVLEQAPAFTAIGAGLGLYANAMKALTYLGADAYWRENVMIGNDCGFASQAATKEIDPKVGWAKFAALAEGARIASERLWRG